MEGVTTEEKTPVKFLVNEMQQESSILPSHPLPVLPYGNMSIQCIHPLTDSRYLEMLQHNHALNQQCLNGVPSQYNSQLFGGGNLHPYVVYYSPTENSSQTLEHAKDRCKTFNTGCRNENRDINALEDPIHKLLREGANPILDVMPCNSANIIFHPLATHMYPECLSRSILLDSKSDMSEYIKAEPKVEFGGGQYGSDGCWYPLVYNKACVPALSCNPEDRQAEYCSGATDIQDYLNSLVYNKPCVPALKYGNDHSEDRQVEYCSGTTDFENYYHPLSSGLAQPLQSKDKFQEESVIHRSLPVRQSLHYIETYNHFHHLNLSSEVLGRPRLLPSVKMTGQMCVENLFKQHVRLLFRNFPDRWYFKMARPSINFDNHWTVFKDVAKVRFYCETCLDGWTSMYGVVMFYFKLNCQHKEGTIFCQISGQKCNSCEVEYFQMPLWYPEEAQKVITNLFYSVASLCYGLITPKLIKGRRFGHPQNHHNRHLCEGCYLGVCKLVPIGGCEGQLQGH